MPLKNYTLLVGKPTEITLDDDDSPHIEIRIKANGIDHRIAVNVRSKLHPHALLYAKIKQFNNPMTSLLTGIGEGRHDLSETPQLQLDYVRGDLIKREEMQIAPYRLEGPNNDLQEFLIPLITEAIQQDDVYIYAFGESWGPENNKPDKYFGFLPGNGIHDIHMNQGSSGRFSGSNGVNQDGALFIYNRATNQWTAIFLAFQSQSWETNMEGNPASIIQPRAPEGRTSLDTGIVIISALINAVNPEEGNETVTLLNRTDGILDLSGWTLSDKNDRKEPLHGYSVGAGDTIRIRLSGNSMRLSNNNGQILLKDQTGLTVHSVAYSREDVGAENWSVVF